MNNNNQLKEIPSVIWRGKWIFIIITLVAILGAFVYNEFLSNTKYSSNVSVQVNPLEQPLGSMETQLKKIISTDNFLQYINSDEVLEDVIQELDLDIPVESLRSSVSVRTSADKTSIVVSRIGDSEELNKSIITQLIDSTKKHLKTDLEMEITDTVALYNENISIELDNVRETMNKYEDIFGGTYLENMTFLQRNLLGEGRILEVSDSLLNEINNLSIEEQLAYIKLSTKINKHVVAYDQYVSLHEDALAIKEMDLVNLTFFDFESGAINTSLVGPNKPFNYFAAIMLGIFGSLFIVLFRNYWRQIFKS